MDTAEKFESFRRLGYGSWKHKASLYSHFENKQAIPDAAAPTVLAGHAKHSEFRGCKAELLSSYKSEAAEEEQKTMFDLGDYLPKLIVECQNVFGERLLYVGLQGSYMRDEATDQSDIDVMIILEALSVSDMDAYRKILKKIGDYEKSCGFICGRDEMIRWNPLEVCQLRHTTRDLFGELNDFLPAMTQEDEINYVKLSLGNLYHELCHRYIHAGREKNTAAFRRTCKSMFFLIQNLHFLESGSFVVTKRELKEQVSEEDRTMLEMAELPDDYDYDKAFRLVFLWCQSAFIRADMIQ